MRVLIATSVRIRQESVSHALKKVYGSQVTYFHVLNYQNFMDFFFYEEHFENIDLIILDPTLSGVETAYSIIYHMIEHRVKKDIIFFTPGNTCCIKELEKFLIPTLEEYQRGFRQEIAPDIIQRKYRRSLILYNSSYYFIEDSIKGEAHTKKELYYVLNTYKTMQDKKAEVYNGEEW